jgi:PAS domain-containing protein
MEGEGLMAQRDIEMILIRQLASCLAMPIFIVDPVGNLIFYNESAEHILGRRFDETGEMPATEWATTWVLTDEDGATLAPESLPLSIALSQMRPTHHRFWIQSLDNVRRHVEAVAFPLVGQAERHLGAVAIFWEITQP